MNKSCLLEDNSGSNVEMVTDWEKWVIENPTRVFMCFY